MIKEHDKKVEAAKFRTKYNYFTMGEKNSTYFFNLEKVRAGAKTISALRLADGLITKNPKIILKEERIFYEKLYGALESRDWNYKNVIGPKVLDHDKKQLEEQLMANNKSPGCDGIFWIHLKDLYCRTV